MLRCNETHQWSQLQPYWNCYLFQVKCIRHALIFSRFHKLWHKLLYICLWELLWLILKIFPDIKINMCIVMTPHELHFFSLKIFIVWVILKFLYTISFCTIEFWCVAILCRTNNVSHFVHATQLTFGSNLESNPIAPITKQHMKFSRFRILKISLSSFL